MNLPTELNLNELQKNKLNEWLKKQEELLKTKKFTEEEETCPTSPIIFKIQDTGLGAIVQVFHEINGTDCDLTLDDDGKLCTP